MGTSGKPDCHGGWLPFLSISPPISSEYRWQLEAISKASVCTATLLPPNVSPTSSTGVEPNSPCPRRSSFFEQKKLQSSARVSSGGPPRPPTFAFGSAETRNVRLTKSPATVASVTSPPSAAISSFSSGAAPSVYTGRCRPVKGSVKRLAFSLTAVRYWW